MLKVTYNDKQITCIATSDCTNTYIGKLIVDYTKYESKKLYDEENRNWTYGNTFDLTISSWYVEESYKHQGYGKKVLREIFKAFKPYNINSLKYIWNGTNKYVGEWLKKFNAKCCCPLAVLKTSEEDTWESHIYELDVNRFMNYINTIE